jgi:hypothetical protein
MNIMDEICLALQEEASELADHEPGARPDWADIRIAAAFERLATNIARRLEKEAVDLDATGHFRVGDTVCAAETLAAPGVNLPGVEIGTKGKVLAASGPDGEWATVKFGTATWRCHVDELEHWAP